MEKVPLQIREYDNELACTVIVLEIGRGGALTK